VDGRQFQRFLSDDRLGRPDPAKSDRDSRPFSDPHAFANAQAFADAQPVSEPQTETDPDAFETYRSRETDWCDEWAGTAEYERFIFDAIKSERHFDVQDAADDFGAEPRWIDASSLNTQAHKTGTVVGDILAPVPSPSHARDPQSGAWLVPAAAASEVVDLGLAQTDNTCHGPGPQAGRPRPSRPRRSMLYTSSAALTHAACVLAGLGSVIAVWGEPGAAPKVAALNRSTTALTTGSIRSLPGRSAAFAQPLLAGQRQTAKAAGRPQAGERASDDRAGSAVEPIRRKSVAIAPERLKLKSLVQLAASKPVEPVRGPTLVATHAIEPETLREPRPLAGTGPGLARRVMAAPSERPRPSARLVQTAYHHRPQPLVSRSGTANGRVEPTGVRADNKAGPSSTRDVAGRETLLPLPQRNPRFGRTTKVGRHQLTAARINHAADLLPPVPKSRRRTAVRDRRGKAGTKVPVRPVRLVAVTANASASTHSRPPVPRARTLPAWAERAFRRE